IKCEDPTDPNVKKKQEEIKNRGTESIRAVSSFIQEGQSIQQTMVEEHEVRVATAPPTFWETKGDLFLLGLAAVIALVLTRVTLRRHKEEAEIRALTGVY